MRPEVIYGQDRINDSTVIHGYSILANAMYLKRMDVLCIRILL